MCDKDYLVLSFFLRLIKEKETAEGAEPPRVMALDDYFTTDGKVSCREDSA